MTVTGPYVNKTLFEQAGVELLGPGATWAEWADAANAVASKLDIPIPMAWDRSGHRVSGPAVSLGAQYFDSNGDPKLVDDAPIIQFFILSISPSHKLGITISVWLIFSSKLSFP